MWGQEMQKALKLTNCDYPIMYRGGCDTAIQLSVLLPHLVTAIQSNSMVFITCISSINHLTIRSYPACCCKICCPYRLGLICDVEADYAPLIGGCKHQGAKK